MLESRPILVYVVIERTEHIQTICVRIDPNRDATLLDKKATITATVYHHRTRVVLEHINPRFASMFLADVHPLVAMAFRGKEACKAERMCYIAIPYKAWEQEQK